MSLSAQDKINAARVALDRASANVAAFVARRGLLGDAAQVPAEEVRQLRAEIDACRYMIDTMSDAAAEVTHG